MYMLVIRFGLMNSNLALAYHLEGVREGSWLSWKGKKNQERTYFILKDFGDK